MNDYQIGQDIQGLRMRLEALEKGQLGKSGALTQNELSGAQKRNLKLLNQHSREIPSEINKLLRAHDIDLCLASYTLSPDKDEAVKMLNASDGPCCCECGWYVSDCSKCCIISV